MIRLVAEDKIIKAKQSGTFKAVGSSIDARFKSMMIFQQNLKKCQWWLLLAMALFSVVIDGKISLSQSVEQNISKLRSNRNERLHAMKHSYHDNNSTERAGRYLNHSIHFGSRKKQVDFCHFHSFPPIKPYCINNESYW